MNTPSYSHLLSPSSVAAAGHNQQQQQQASLVSTPELQDLASDMRSEVTSLSIDPSSFSHDTHSSLSTTTTASHQPHQQQRKVFKTEYKSKFTPFDQYVYNEVTDSFVKQQQLQPPQTANNARDPSPYHMTTSRSNQDLASISAHEHAAASSTHEAHVFEPVDAQSTAGSVASSEPWYKEVVRRNEKANEYRFKSEIGHQSPLLNYSANHRAESPYCSERQVNSPSSTCVNESPAGDQLTTHSSDARSQHSGDHQTEIGSNHGGEAGAKIRFTPNDYKRDHLIAHMANNNNFTLPKEQQSEAAARASNRAQFSSSARSATRSTAQVRSRSQSTRRQPATSTRTATAQPAAKSNQTTPTRTITTTRTTSRPPAASARTAHKPTTVSSTTPINRVGGTTRPTSAAATNGKLTPTPTTRRVPLSTPTSRLTPKANGTITSNNRPSPASAIRKPATSATARTTPITSKTTIKTASKLSATPSSTQPVRQRGPATSTTDSRPLPAARPQTASATNGGLSRSKTASKTPSSTVASTPSSTSSSTTAIKSIKTPKAIAAATAAAAAAAAAATVAASGPTLISSTDDTPTEIINVVDEKPVAMSASIVSENTASNPPNDEVPDTHFEQYGLQARNNDPFSGDDATNLIFATTEGGNMLADELAQAEKEASNVTKDNYQQQLEQESQQQQPQEPPELFTELRATELTIEHVQASDIPEHQLISDLDKLKKDIAADGKDSDSASESDGDISVKQKLTSSESGGSRAEVVNGLAGGLISAEDRFDSSEREMSTDAAIIEQQVEHQQQHHQQQQQQEPNFDDEPYSIIPTSAQEVSRQDFIDNELSGKEEEVASKVAAELNSERKSDPHDKLDVTKEPEVQEEHNFEDKVEADLRHDLEAIDINDIKQEAKGFTNPLNVTQQSENTTHADTTRDSDDMLTLNDTAAALVDVLDTGVESQIMSNSATTDERPQSVDSISDSETGELEKVQQNEGELIGLPAVDGDDMQGNTIDLNTDGDDLMSKESKALIESSPALVSANTTLQELDVSVISNDAPLFELNKENLIDDSSNIVNISTSEITHNLFDNGEDVKKNENNATKKAYTESEMVQEALEKVQIDDTTDTNAMSQSSEIDNNDVISHTTDERPAEQHQHEETQEEEDNNKKGNEFAEKETQERDINAKELSSSSGSDSEGEGIENRNELLMNVADLIGVESQKREEMARKSELARQNSSPQPQLAQVGEVILSPTQLDEQFTKVSAEATLMQKPQSPPTSKSSSSSSSSVSLVEEEVKKTEFQHQVESENLIAEDQHKDPTEKKLQSEEKAEEVVADSSVTMETNLMADELAKMSLHDDDIDNYDEHQKLSNHLTNSEDELILAPRNYNYSRSSSEQLAHQFRESTGIDLLAQEDHLDGNVELYDGSSAAIEAPTAAENRVEMSTSKSLVPEISQTNYLIPGKLSDESDDDAENGITGEKDPLDAAATISPNSSVAADELLRFNSVKDSILENSLPNEDQLKEKIREMTTGLADSDLENSESKQPRIESVGVTENMIDDTVKQLPPKEDATSEVQREEEQHGELYRQLSKSQHERRASSGFDESTLRRKQSTKSNSSSSSASNSIEEVRPMEPLKSEYDEFASRMASDLITAPKNDNNNSTIGITSGSATDVSTGIASQSDVQEGTKAREPTDLMDNLLG